MPQETSTAAPVVQELEQALASVLLGKPRPIRLALVCLLGNGHLLIEDAPGVGKTSLAKAIAKGLHGTFRRLQFTPDMLPSDILGSSLYLPNLGEFEFREGPVFTNILLADEINRTTPRTQSALLEAMSEYQVSVEGRTLPLPDPFFVIATQNPFEFEGTYPLPENQLDRFMICTGIGYPDREFERELLASRRDEDPIERMPAVLDAATLEALRRQVVEVTVEETLNEYILDIISATRTHEDLHLGVSTRGALTLYRAVQAYAFLEGRTYAVPDDVKTLAEPVLAHRIVCRGLFREGHRDQARRVIRQIVGETVVPS